MLCSQNIAILVVWTACSWHIGWLLKKGCQDGWTFSLWMHSVLGCQSESWIFRLESFCSFSSLIVVYGVVGNGQGDQVWALGCGQGAGALPVNYNKVWTRRAWQGNKVATIGLGPEPGPLQSRSWIGASSQGHCSSACAWMTDELFAASPESWK